jgi:PPIC-type PPIASE domain
MQANWLTSTFANARRSFAVGGCALLLALGLGGRGATVSAQGEPSPVPDASAGTEAPIMRVGKRAFDRKQLIDELSFLPPATLQRLRRDDNYARIFAVQRFHTAMFAAAAEEDGFLARTPGLKGAAAANSADVVSRFYIKNTVLSTLRPSESELDQFYKLNRSLCVDPPRYRLAKIVILLSPRATDKEGEGAKERLDAAEARLKKGDDFATVADETSDVPTRAGGGDLGWFSEKELEQQPVAADVKPLGAGGVSKPIRTPRGHEIVKVLDKQERKEKSFADCRPLLLDKFIEQYAKNAVQRRADELVKQMNASLNLDAFIAAARAVPAQPGEEEVETAVP